MRRLSVLFGLAVLSCQDSVPPYIPDIPDPDLQSAPEYVRSIQGSWTNVGGLPPVGLDISPSHQLFVTATWTVSHGPTYDVFSLTQDGSELSMWRIVGNAAGIGVGQDGSVFVISTYYETVTHVSATGVKLNSWGPDRSAPGWLSFPWQAAVDSLGFVYVCDVDRVEKYSQDGEIAGGWETPAPRGIAVGPGGLVFVSEVSTNNLRIYTTDGELVAQRQLTGPAFGLDTDAEGNLYATDGVNGTINEYDSNGVWLASWGPVTSLSDVAVDHDVIYALRSEAPSLVAFARDGSILRTWHAGVGRGIDARDGDIYVMALLGSLVRRYTSDGTLVSEWGVQGSGFGQFKTPQDVTLGNENELYVCDTGNRRVQKFNRDGLYLLQVGDYRYLDGNLANPTDLDLDSKGNVYVADTGNNRIQKFTPEGLFLTKWGEQGAGNSQFDSPRGIAVNDRDQVFVWDTGNQRVQWFDERGGFLGAWPVADSSGVLGHPPTGLVGVDAGPDGVVYLVDSERRQVVKFSVEGRALARWGSAGTTPGTFTYPTNIAVDPAGSVFVIDRGRGVIARFDYQDHQTQ